MLVLTNTTEQTLQPGQAISFDRVLHSSGNGECWRSESGRLPTTGARMRANGIYAPTFAGNIGGVAAGPASVAIAVGGQILPETNMIVTTATAGDLSNVSSTTRIMNGSCCGGDRISVVNSGTTPLTVGANSVLVLERRA